ncbi:MAG: radical SAM protein [Sphaerochaetaceae bacterium]|nr:radical SAM protein [Sphaerochaetaceae bacterium]
MKNQVDESLYYSDCTLCPNACHVNRLSGQKGICGQSSEIRIAWSGLHRGEEPPVSGEKGSGMVFFCGCPLHCQYCQNYQISRTTSTSWLSVSTEELSCIFLELQKAGAATLNLVTGTHYIPSIINALHISHAKGFSLPVVWNSSGYETVEALRLIDNYVDLYLLDAKAIDKNVASSFCATSKYPEVLSPVLKFLKRRYKETDLDNLKGVLIRHLVFPGTIEQSKAFLHFFADNFKENFMLSLMTQFVPPKKLSPNQSFPRITDKEYEELSDLVDVLGIDGFIQERSENEILWIPDFRRDQPFPEGFADPLPYFLSLKHN